MATDVPAFFVPNTEPEDFETAYADLAAACGAHPAGDGQRIYSIDWVSNGELWTATVGEKLRGIKTVVKGTGRSKREIEVPRSSSDLVLAVFEHVPFYVAHDGKSGEWNMPISASENPKRVVRFPAQG